MAEVTVKKSEMLALVSTIQSLSNEPQPGTQGRELVKLSRKAAYALAKTLKLLEPDMVGYNAEMKPYNDARLAVMRELAVKNKEGIPVTAGGSFDFGPNESKKNEALKNLREEHKIEEHLEDEIKITVHALDYDNLPGFISAIHLSGLLPMLVNCPEEDVTVEKEKPKKVEEVKPSEDK